MITITDIAAFGGIIFGLTGMILGIMSYLRDKPKISVNLKWDMEAVGDMRYSRDKLWGMVTVTNTGRRPIYMSHVHLRLPKGFDSTHLLLSEGIRGDRIEEGDPPKTYMIDQESLTKYKNAWNKMYAVAIDSTGKEYKSSKVKEQPAWAK
jgi:hypothetical protein